jgi:hypothetical protein
MDALSHTLGVSRKSEHTLAAPVAYRQMRPPLQSESLAHPAPGGAGTI